MAIIVLFILLNKSSADGLQGSGQKNLSPADLFGALRYYQLTAQTCLNAVVPLI